MLDGGFNVFVIFVIVMIAVAIVNSYKTRKKPPSQRRPSDNNPSHTPRNNATTVKHTHPSHVEREIRDYYNNAPTFYNTIYKQRAIHDGKGSQRSQQTWQAKAKYEVIRTLYAPSVKLPIVLRNRAIMLYQKQHGVMWLEARMAIEELERGLNKAHMKQAFSFQQGADPIVTYLLLQANYREDALTYFCQSTGANMAEAITSVDYIQELLDTNNPHFMEESPKKPDPAAIHYLLETGHKVTAIRYYRQCTKAELAVAKDAIDNFYAS